MIYTHVLNRRALGVRSPVDRLGPQLSSHSTSATHGSVAARCGDSAPTRSPSMPFPLTRPTRLTPHPPYPPYPPYSSWFSFVVATARRSICCAVTGVDGPWNMPLKSSLNVARGCVRKSIWLA